MRRARYQHVEISRADARGQPAARPTRQPATWRSKRPRSRRRSNAARFPMLAGKKLCLVSILRAGNGILDGMLDLVPSARVGHIGIYREPRTLRSRRILSEAAGGPARARRDPGRSDAGDRQFGGRGDLAACRAAGALDQVRLPRRRARRDRRSAPRLSRGRRSSTAAIDRCLDDHGYILPGLGDAGDRLFGTK